MTLPDHHGSPARFVLMIPRVRVGPVQRKEVDNQGKAAIGRAMHCCFFVVINSVDIQSQREQELQCLDHFGLGSGFLADRSHSDTRSGHQWRAAINVCEFWVRSKFK